MQIFHGLMVKHIKPTAHENFNSLEVSKGIVQADNRLSSDVFLHVIYSFVAYTLLRQLVIGLGEVSNRPVKSQEATVILEFIKYFLNCFSWALY